MACSHNVIRAGLTHKYRDVDTLCDMVDYNGRQAEQMKLQPTNIDSSQNGVTITHFQPSVPDFALTVIQVC